MDRHMVLICAFLLVCITSNVFAGSCLDIVEEIEEAQRKTGQDDADVEGDDAAFEHEIYSITNVGVGVGYIYRGGFDRIGYDLFLARLWEVWRYGSLRLGGEVVCDFEDAVLGDLAAGFVVYPFEFGLTPVLGIEAGVGYLHSEGEGSFGYFLSGETGVYALRVAAILLSATARVVLMQGREEEFLLGGVLRVGVFF